MCLLRSLRWGQFHPGGKKGEGSCLGEGCDTQRDPSMLAALQGPACAFLDLWSSLLTGIMGTREGLPFWDTDLCWRLPAVPRTHSTFWTFWPETFSLKQTFQFGPSFGKALSVEMSFFKEDVESVAWHPATTGFHAGPVPSSTQTLDLPLGKSCFRLGILERNVPCVRCEGGETQTLKETNEIVRVRRCGSTGLQVVRPPWLSRNVYLVAAAAAAANRKILTFALSSSRQEVQFKSVLPHGPRVA